jgi:hypothetical protein
MIVTAAAAAGERVGVEGWPSRSVRADDIRVLSNAMVKLTGDSAGIPVSI